MGDGGAAKQAAKAEQKEFEREGKIRMGTQDIRNKFASAFNDDYYKDFEKAGTEYYKPQLDSQYKESLNQLQAALARNGLGQSSVAVTQADRLKRQNQTANDQVAENIRNQSNQRKSDVANQESVAVGQLQASADPAAASQQAANLIKSQTALPGWSPLGQVFTDATAGLATQGDLERANQNRYNAGVSQWGNNARRFLQNVG
jgi:hypothetical protein